MSNATKFSGYETEPVEEFELKESFMLFRRYVANCAIYETKLSSTKSKQKTVDEGAIALKNKEKFFDLQAD